MPSSASEETPTPVPPPGSSLAPFTSPVFRMMWFAWLAANTSQWMNDVAAAWVMTSLTSVPIWVALVQSASTLPVFVLGLPSGALADIVDRKRYFMVTQFWVAVTALLMCAAIASGRLNPALLLALTFANGIGLAMRWPVFAAIVPELVPRSQLPAALALNAVSGNASRIIGPLLAGALIASLGSAYVFALNAVLAVASAWVISRWRRTPVERPLGRERLVSAMRVGVQFMRQSAHLRGVLARMSLFFFHSTALIAMLPLVARDLHGGGAGTYTLLLASMGTGAICVATVLPRLRQRWSRNGLVLRGVLLQSVSMAAVALAPSPWVAVPAMFATGMAWLSTANSLSVSAQMGLPDWVRARGMSILQMSIMGASAFGAGVWGQVATWTTVQTSLLLASVSGIVGALLVDHFMEDNTVEEDLTPTDKFRVPMADAPPPSGRVVVTIEYQIDPQRAADFRALMQEGRRSRLRHGALSWELLHDIGDPGRFIEQVVDESWTDHQRRVARATAADAELRDRKLAFHIGESPPLVRRCVMESTIRDS